MRKKLSQFLCFAESQVKKHLLQCLNLACSCYCQKGITFSVVGFVWFLFAVMSYIKLLERYWGLGGGKVTLQKSLNVFC